jgi:hypothetical protein
MHPEHMTRIVERKRYDTATATLIASDCYWDGNNFERSGRNTWLYKTPKGAYFTTTRTCWQGEQDTLEPLTQDEAVELYEGDLTEHEVDYRLSFPGVTVEEA